MSQPLETRLQALFSRRRAGRGNLAIRPDFFTLLERLGNPHRHLPPVIHVAGTNGKGSTIAFMRAILHANGNRVHAYTSPHLLRYHERFVLAGREVDDATLLAAMDAIDAAMDGLDLAFLEITPALGFYLFANHGADILLLETGLGGRLDHTNIVENPLVTVITTLSYDHTHLLGNTIEEIAFEKAGIMKPGVPCVIGHQIYNSVLPVLQSHAAKIGAPLIMERDWAPLLPPDRPLGLAGDHQRWNAGAALAALRVQNCIALGHDAILSGLQNAAWPGRLHRITRPDLPPGWDFYFDGAHNDSGASVLANWIASQDRPVHILCAMKSDKSPYAFLSALAPVAASITPLSGLPGMIAGDDFASHCAAHGVRLLHPPAPLETALPRILSIAVSPGIILCTGSLYLAPHILPPPAPPSFRERAEA